ncbi:hypothetical protein KIV66_gp93 [Mycobacterium phage MyraDee]|uniref:Uncharacterized protein n=1 Tax=Mycobacterium phage MyraDee TaxID=2024303 RepID=A0A222YZH4_9CAUD|nr:hypothetical protein KIV66_gp93 [Mycobacterium phage MyraDee]ASR77200.1 hypothetical protein SEA_MYRADEE_93 [Mycobacterium phage MyraDee]
MDYRWLRAWDRMMGSLSYWTEAQLANARTDEAPANAIYRKAPGVWATTDDIESVETFRRLARLV